MTRYFERRSNILETLTFIGLIFVTDGILRVDQCFAQTSNAITGVGRVSSAREPRYLAAERDAIIHELHVETEEPVFKGQLLVTLSCESLAALLDIAKARLLVSQAEHKLIIAPPRIFEVDAERALLESAKLAYEEHKLRLAREESLGKKGYVSSQDLDSLRLMTSRSQKSIEAIDHKLEQILHGARPEAREKAKLNVKLDRARMRSAQANYETCKLRSPIDGTVLRILKRPGEHSGASNSQPLLVVADLTTLSVKAEISESDAFRIKAGAPAEVWINGEARKFRGYVKRVARLTGRRETRGFDPGDRFDRDVVEVELDGFKENLPPIIGLRVVTAIEVQ